MDEFVRLYPDVIIGLLSVLVAIIGTLLAALFVLVKKSVDDLAQSLRDAISEIRDDRKTDRIDIGQLLDRMQRQETLCAEHRKHCPVFTN